MTRRVRPTLQTNQNEQIEMNERNSSSLRNCSPVEEKRMDSSSSSLSSSSAPTEWANRRCRELGSDGEYNWWPDAACPTSIISCREEPERRRERRGEKRTRRTNPREMRLQFDESFAEDSHSSSFPCVGCVALLNPSS